MFIYCQNNDFERETDPSVTFNKLLVLVSSLPAKSIYDFGLLTISETPNTATFKMITDSKNWTLKTVSND